MEEDDRNTKKKKPKYNSGVGSIIHINMIITSLTEIVLDDSRSFYEYFSLLDSWYLEILPLVIKKVKTDMEEDQKAAEKNINYKKLTEKEKVRLDFEMYSNKTITYDEYEKLVTRRNFNKNEDNRSVVSLKQYHESLSILTDKIGLRISLVNEENRNNWMGED